MSVEVLTCTLFCGGGSGRLSIHLRRAGGGHGGDTVAAGGPGDVPEADARDQDPWRPTPGPSRATTGAPSMTSSATPTWLRCSSPPAPPRSPPLRPPPPRPPPAPPPSAPKRVIWGVRRSTFTLSPAGVEEGTKEGELRRRSRKLRGRAQAREGEQGAPARGAELGSERGRRAAGLRRLSGIS